MGLVFGIIIALFTPAAAFVALMSGSNWETGEGGNLVGGISTLVIGWLIAGLIIVSHFHPIHLGW